MKLWIAIPLMITLGLNLWLRVALRRHNIPTSRIADMTLFVANGLAIAAAIMSIYTGKG